MTTTNDLAFGLFASYEEFGMSERGAKDDKGRVFIYFIFFYILLLGRARAVFLLQSLHVSHDHQSSTRKVLEWFTHIDFEMDLSMEGVSGM